MRVIIHLRDFECDALRLLAEREFRDWRSQAALIIRQDLERRGLLDAQDHIGHVQANQELRGVQDAS